MPYSVPSGAMETYLVGGAVRDRLLGLAVHDRDWVVVGETPDAMHKAGFRSVGKDFPVFLHPETHEEYALARTERKTGPGYRGFTFNTDPTVTLEEDLLRRDFTINAMAESANGQLIDPVNGQSDLQQRVIRHVSPAFAEDPVRVLRAARFMARFSRYGFSLAPETTELMRSMVASGEVDHLVAERVWQELDSALQTSSPTVFFNTLETVGALDRVMPELHMALQHFSKTIDAVNPMLHRLTVASQCFEEPHIRFAALCVLFGESRSSDLEAFCSRLHVPNAYTNLAMLCAKHSAVARNAIALEASELQTLLKKLDVHRRAERFLDFLDVVAIDTRAAAPAVDSNGTAIESAPGPAGDTHNQSNVNRPCSTAATRQLQTCANAMLSIDAASIARQAPSPTSIAANIAEAEVLAIQDVLKTR